MSETETLPTFVAPAALSDVLNKPQTFAELIAEIEAAIADQVVDLETERGRKAIASLARKIASTKVAIDNFGKTLNEEANARIKAVNATRKAAETKLQTLQERARKPLTDWENAEKARAEKAGRIMDFLQRAGSIQAGELASGIEARHAALLGFEIDDAVMLDDAAEAARLKHDALTALRNGAVAAVKAEAEAAELAELRATRAKADQIIRDQEAATAAEAQRVAEAARIAKAADDARIAAEAAAEAKIAAAEARAVEAERKAAEPPVAPAPVSAPFLGIGRPAPARSAPAGDARPGAAVAALVKLAGLSDGTARRVVGLIAEGKVPGITMQERIAA